MLQLRTSHIYYILTLLYDILTLSYDKAVKNDKIHYIITTDSTKFAWYQLESLALA